MSARITISLPADLVAELDAAAERTGLSRSAVIREASTSYLSKSRRTAEAERRQAAGDALLEFLHEHDGLPVSDDRPVADILRELRGPLGDATAGAKPAGDAPVPWGRS